MLYTTAFQKLFQNNISIKFKNNLNTSKYKISFSRSYRGTKNRTKY